MRAPFARKARWVTQWAGTDIVVRRNEVEVDRISAPAIRRVVFVQATQRVPVSESSFALVELEHEFVVFPSETGFAGRVHFERQAFWASKACVHWAVTATAGLPPNALARRGWTLGRRAPRYLRLPRAEMEPWLSEWTIGGPQSWDERRWQQIERSRPPAHRESRLPALTAEIAKTGPPLA